MRRLRVENIKWELVRPCWCCHQQVLRRGATQAVAFHFYLEQVEHCGTSSLSVTSLFTACKSLIIKRFKLAHYQGRIFLRPGACDSRPGAGAGWGLASLHLQRNPSPPLRTALHTPPLEGNLAATLIFRTSVVTTPTRAEGYNITSRIPASLRSLVAKTSDAYAESAVPTP